MQLSDILAFLRKNALYILFFFLPALSVAMHWRVFQTDLVGVHVWRQVQTQTVIVNFYEEDFNILNPRLDPRGSGDGSGLGLAIARRIVERHGGRLWVESAVGEGTSFSFSVPGDGTGEGR